MKLRSFFIFYGIISVFYGCYKCLFVFVRLYDVSTSSSHLEQLGFLLYMLFSISVAATYLKRLRYSIPIALFSLFWTSNIVWIWVYLHVFIS